MTNFDVLKEEITKCKSGQQLTNLLDMFRYGVFPCEMNSNCFDRIVDCSDCYAEWLDKEI